jgi:hypothetical protein
MLVHPAYRFGVMNATRRCWWQRTATGERLASGPVRSVPPEVDRKAFLRLFHRLPRLREGGSGEDSNQHPCAGRFVHQAGSRAACWLDGDTSADAAFAAERGWIHILLFVTALLKFEPTPKTPANNAGSNPLATCRLLSHSLSRHLGAHGSRMAFAPTPVGELEAG